MSALEDVAIVGAVVLAAIALLSGLGRGSTGTQTPQVVIEQREQVEQAAEGTDRTVETDPFTGLATFGDDAATDFSGYTSPFGDATSPLETFENDMGERFVDINPGI